MKVKTVSQFSAIILFIISIISLGMLLTGKKPPNLLSIAMITIIFFTFIFGFIITKNSKNLLYLAFIAYFIMALPLIVPIINGTFLYWPIIYVSFLLIVIFLYNELCHINKK